MPRKNTGSTTTTRSRKTAVSNGSTPMEPSAVQAPPEVRTNGEGAVLARMNAGASPIVLNLDDEIRRRAYELYLQRNGAAGDPNRDWFVAEREVRARHAVAGHSA
jgi:hypothetical protein